MQKVVLDTSFLYSVFDESDPNHSEIFSILNRLEDGGEVKFYISYGVIGELMCSKYETDFITRCRIFSRKFYGYTDKDLEFIKTLRLELRNSLKANDCFSLALCKRYQAELFTFDKKLENAYKELF